MNCEDYRLQLVEYLDDELARPEREKLAAHLQSCPACRELADQMEQSLAVFQAALRSVPVSARSEAAIHPAEARPAWFRRPRFSWLALAAAAVLVVGAGVYFRLTSAERPVSQLTPAEPVAGVSLNAPVSEPSFVFHGQGVSRKNRLDLKL